MAHWWRLTAASVPHQRLHEQDAIQQQAGCELRQQLRGTHTHPAFTIPGDACAEDVSAFYKSHCVFRQKKRHEQSLAPPSVASIAVRCT